MLRFRRKPQPHGIYDPNMTPLIDVSLVLVVILMVTTPMAYQSGIAVRNAASASRSKAQPAKSDRIEIVVMGEDSLWINRQRIHREQVVGTLGPLLQASATRQVVVRCADSVSHAVFVEMLDLARYCGAEQIGVLTTGT